MKDEENALATEAAAETEETVEAAAEAAEAAEEAAVKTEETADEAKALIEEALVPMRELLSPRAFFRRTLKLDRFSVISGDNKYKLEVLTEINKRRDFAFRYACLFCLGMLVYCMVMGFLSFNMLLTNRYYWVVNHLPGVGFAVLAPIALVFIPAPAAVMMKQYGVLFVILIFMIFTALYIIWGYYFFIPFTVFGAYAYMRQNSVIDIYEALSEEDGFPDFSDFTFEHKTTVEKKEQN
jgi:hypothetical protein